MKMPDKLWTMVRSGIAGAVATVADLGVLALMVGALGVSARVANVPALLIGAVVQFFGNRYFAFDATHGSANKQAGLFVLSEVVAVTLNAVGYDLFARAVALDTLGALLVRLGISFVVFVSWSHPVWRRIFSPPPAVST